MKCLAHFLYNGHTIIQTNSISLLDNGGRYRFGSRLEKMAAESIYGPIDQSHSSWRHESNLSSKQNISADIKTSNHEPTSERIFVAPLKNFLKFSLYTCLLSFTEYQD